MTKKAFDKIADGLREAIAIARGKGGTAMTTTDDHMPIDRKFAGEVRKIDTGELVDDFIVFRAKDDIVPALLAFYQDQCERHNCPFEHLLRIMNLRTRVDQWRAANPHRCKLPD
jgi:hypothetical protein